MNTIKLWHVLVVITRRFTFWIAITSPELTLLSLAQGELALLAGWAAIICILGLLRQ